MTKIIFILKQKHTHTHTHNDNYYKIILKLSLCRKFNFLDKTLLLKIKFSTVAHKTSRTKTYYFNLSLYFTSSMLR